MAGLNATQWRRRPTVLLLAVVLALIWYTGLVSPGPFGDGVTTTLTHRHHQQMIQQQQQEQEHQYQQQQRQQQQQEQLRKQNNGAPRPHHEQLPPESLTKDVKHLRKHIKTSKYTYAQRLVRTRPFTGERQDLSVSSVETLFPPPETLDGPGNHQPGADARNADVRIPSLKPLELAVPEPPAVNTSIISFGIATSVSRLEEASRQFLHWLGNRAAPLLVLSSPDDHIFTMQAHLRELGLDATIETSQDRTPLAFFGLIKRLYDSRGPDTQWLALIDDDTFVPSLPTLAEHLTSTYRADREVMVTAMSDSLEQIEEWGLQAFGGGGIFISVPLAARLTRQAVWERCAEMAQHRDQGDQIVSHCLNHYTDVRPMFDPLLHQMDIMGGTDTPAGYFESGRRMLTVHHWRTWFHVNIPKAGLVARACGPEGLFQRWSFPKSNMVLSNGFSIAEYPAGLDFIDFAAVEKTWKGDDSNFLHKVGPLRPPLTGATKTQYRFVDSDVVEDWFVRQTYISRGVRLDNDEPEMDQVLELLWLI